MKNPLTTISRRVNQAMEISLFTLGITMAVTVAVQVFFRYVLNRSLFWSEELARFMLIWLTFLGASVAYYRGAHPGVDAFVARMPDSLKKAAGAFVRLVSVAFFLVMIVYGAKFAHFVRLQISPALSLPKWIIFSIVPLSGVVLLIHSLSGLIDDMIKRAADS